VTALVYQDIRHGDDVPSSNLTDDMLALSALIRTVSGLLGRLSVHCAEFLAGIEEARAMALAYQNLANLLDRELAARGLTRADIPRAVLAAFNSD
jgi:hypothetical protein